MEFLPTHDAEQALDATFSKLQHTVTDLISKLAANVKSSNTRTLISTIQDHMAGIRACIRDLEEFAEEQDILEDTERLIVKVSRRKAAYEALQMDFRKANLQVRKNAEQAAADERKALLGSPDPLERQQRLQTEAGLGEAAEDITAALQRTRQQMAQELEHTSATLTALEESDSTLKAAKDEFVGQKTGHRRSHRLLGTMRRHSVLDVVTLWGGVAMFMLVVIYIVGKRSLYFVPGFAKELIKAPFRSSPKNLTVEKETISSMSGVAKQQDWELEEELQTDVISNDRLEDVGSLHKDLQSSADVDAGLNESHLAKLEAENLSRTFADHSEAAKAQAAAAYPGSWGDMAAASSMKAQVIGTESAPSIIANTTAQSDNNSIPVDSENVTALGIVTAGQNAKEIEIPASAKTPGDLEAASLPHRNTSEAAEHQEDALEPDSASDANFTTSEDDYQSLQPDDEEAIAKEAEANVLTPTGSLNVTANGVSEADTQQTGGGGDDEEAVSSTNSEVLVERWNETAATIETRKKEGKDLRLNTSEDEMCAVEECSIADQEEGVELNASEGLGDDDMSEDYHEPISEVATLLLQEEWEEKEDRGGLLKNSPTTRQEDTELGIFRPGGV